MKKIKTLEEVHKELKAAGFEFLGFRIICDCYHYYWARPLLDALVAKAEQILAEHGLSESENLEGGEMQ